MPPILNEPERNAMRAAGRFNAQLMDAIRDLVVPGACLADIDQFVYRYTTDHGHIPAPLGYKGFPKSCCISVNEVVCHGIPDDLVLRDGDIVNVDLTTIVDGWHGDSSETFMLGAVSEEASRLVKCALDCLNLGIAAAKPCGLVSDIGKAITDHAKGEGFSVVTMFQGHGLGRKFHTDPGIPHFANEGRAVLVPGVAFTIEPMINAGTHRCAIDEDDGWTARTADGRLSAQFEHTLLMTEEGPEILTLTKGGP
jgi:methionyl aminopeptidase